MYRDDTENFLRSLETLVESLDVLMNGSITATIIREVRAELTECGMEPSYRDQFIARAEVKINADLDEDQLNRLKLAARKMARKFYTFFRDEGYNDQAIALMGGQFSLTFDA